MIKYLLFLFVIISCKGVNPAEGLTVEQGDVLYSANVGKNVLPPTEFNIDDKGENPVLTWVPRKEAVYYKIYRKDDGEKNFEAIKDIDGNPILLQSEEYIDYEISKSNEDSIGIHEYCISSVYKFNRESFKSNPKLVVFTLSDLSLKNLEVSDGYDSINTSNKIGIRLTIEPPEGAISFLIMRKLEGAADYIVVDKDASLIDGKYYIDFPKPELVQEKLIGGPGYDYTYRVYPKDKDGKLGKPIEANGFVYSAPVIEEILQPDVSILNLKLSTTKEDTRILLEYSDDPKGTWTELPNDDKIKNNQEMDLSSKISTLLGSKLTRQIYFRAATAIYEGENLKWKSPYCEIKPAKIMSGDIAVLALVESISVTHGTKEPNAVEPTSKISLSWQKLSGNLEGYNIYRTEALAIDGENDNSVWEQVGSIKHNSADATITWVDEDSTDFGAYYYQIKSAFGSGAGEDKDNNTIDRIAKGAIKVTGVETTATERTNLNTVNVTWTNVDADKDVLVYKLERKAKDATSWTVLASNMTTNSYTDTFNKTGENLYTAAQLYDYRVTPQIIFKNYSVQLNTVDCTYSIGTGIIDVTDIEWTKLVMRAITEGQSRVTGAERAASSFSNGGIDYTKTISEDPVSKIEFKRRSYFDWGKSENEKYDVYKFTNFFMHNGVIHVDGAIYHLFFTTAPAVNVSFSSTDFTIDHSSADDKIAKKQGTISIKGVYPGEIQLWFKNSGYDNRNSQYSFYPISDYPESQIYVSANNSNINWYSDSYGLKVKSTDEPSINKDTAYAIKRDTNSTWTKISHSQVGAVR